MRKNLQVADLGDLLDQPWNATLATYLPSGEILLAPVWHEWQDGGFNVFVAANDIKHRNVKRDPRASMTVSESGGLNRGIEVRGIAQLHSDNLDTLSQRIILRYLGPKRTERFLKVMEGASLVHIRLEPGKMRAWDFADEEALLPAEAKGAYNHE